MSAPTPGGPVPACGACAALMPDGTVTDMAPREVAAIGCEPNSDAAPAARAPTEADVGWRSMPGAPPPECCCCCCLLSCSSMPSTVPWPPAGGEAAGDRPTLAVNSRGGVALLLPVGVAAGGTALNGGAPALALAAAWTGLVASGLAGTPLGPSPPPRLGDRFGERPSSASRKDEPPPPLSLVPSPLPPAAVVPPPPAAAAAGPADLPLATMGLVGRVARL